MDGQRRVELPTTPWQGVILPLNYYPIYGALSPYRTVPYPLQGYVLSPDTPNKAWIREEYGSYSILTNSQTNQTDPSRTGQACGMYNGSCHSLW